MSLAAIRGLLMRPLLYVAVAAGVASFFGSITLGGGPPATSPVVIETQEEEFTGRTYGVEFKAIHQILQSNHTPDAVNIWTAGLDIDVTNNGPGGEGLHCIGQRVVFANEISLSDTDVLGWDFHFHDELGADLLVSNTPLLIREEWDRPFLKGDGTGGKVQIITKVSDEVNHTITDPCKGWNSTGQGGWNFFADGWDSIAPGGITLWGHLADHHG